MSRRISGTEANIHICRADQKWLTLTNALSGLFCASLNFIDATRTTRPVMSFQPEGDYPNTTSSSSHLLYGTLPREVVCTENLTPFLKLLPCKGKVGIASLLDGHKLFDASWQSMAIDVRPVCPNGEDGECVLEIGQTIDMVLDVERSKRPRGTFSSLSIYGRVSTDIPQTTRYPAQSTTTT
jgi:GPI-anchor transamidase subunit T